MDYSQGKIYKIITPHCDKYYIGSTADSLNGRFANHIQDYKKFIKGKHAFVSSYDLFKLGLDDVRIELLEKFPCNSKKELERREGELHRQYADNIVNLVIAGRTEKEWRIDNKEYISQTYFKDKVNADPKYKQKLLDDNKIWRENNKERRAIYQKEYELKNRELLKQKRKEREALKKQNI